MTSSETVQGVIQSIREQREKFERFCRSLSEEELARPAPDSAWYVATWTSEKSSASAKGFRARTRPVIEQFGFVARKPPFLYDG